MRTRIRQVILHQRGLGQYANPQRYNPSQFSSPPAQPLSPMLTPETLSQQHCRCTTMTSDDRAVCRGSYRRVGWSSTQYGSMHGDDEVRNDDMLIRPRVWHLPAIGRTEGTADWYIQSVTTGRSNFVHHKIQEHAVVGTLECCLHPLLHVCYCFLVLLLHSAARHSHPLLPYQNHW